jgi:hypothetical protein
MDRGGNGLQRRRIRRTGASQRPGRERRVRPCRRGRARDIGIGGPGCDSRALDEVILLRTPTPRTVRIDSVVRRGPPWEKLANGATELGADMIVIGADGQRGAASHGFLGTAASRLATSSRRSVVVVPSPLSGREEPGRKVKKERGTKPHRLAERWEPAAFFDPSFDRDLERCGLFGRLALQAKAPPRATQRELCR